MEFDESRFKIDYVLWSGLKEMAVGFFFYYYCCFIFFSFFFSESLFENDVDFFIGDGRALEH